MSTEATIFTGVGIYLVIMLMIGIYGSKRAGSAADFIVSGRSMPIWICSVTLMATWFGGGTMMGAAGAAYDEGLLGVIADRFGVPWSCSWRVFSSSASLTQKFDPPRPVLNSDGEEVKLKDRLGTLPLFRRAD